MTLRYIEELKKRERNKQEKAKKKKDEVDKDHYLSSEAEVALCGRVESMQRCINCKL